MSKVSITEIDNIHTPGAATSINSNFTAIQTVIDSLLSRTGLAPNFMDSVLDMNGYNIINVGTITTTDGTGGTGSTYGLLYDGTEQGVELQAVLDSAGTTALTYGPQVVKLVSNEGPLTIGSRVKVPSNVTLDTSLIKINFILDGELSIYGDYEELPETNLFRLAADAEPGDTTITVDASDYGSYTLLAVDAFGVLRGENDQSGNAIQKHEFRISAVDDSGGISALVLTIDPPIPDDQGTFTPINEGSLWTPGESGIDRSLVTIRTTSLVSGNIARGDISFTVADGTKFAAGEVALLQDNRQATDPGDTTTGNPIRQEPVKIKSIATNTITLDRCVSRDFLTAQDAVLIKLIAVENAHIKGGLMERTTTPDASPASRRHCTQIVFGDKCSISGVILDEDSHTYSVRGAVARLTRSIDCSIYNCIRIGPKYTTAGDGYGITNYYSTDSKIHNNYTERCRHGFVNQGSTRAFRFNNVGVDNLINTLDDHGLYETDSMDVSNKAVGGGSLAADSTQQVGATYGNTRWYGGSHFAVSVNNTFNNFSDGGIAIRPGVTNFTEANHYIDCGLPIRVYADRRAPTVVTEKISLNGNVVDDPSVAVSIDGRMPLWSSEDDISGTTARPTYLDDSSGTRRYSTTGSGALGTTNPTHTSGSATNGDVTLTYVGLVASQVVPVQNVYVRVKADYAATLVEQYRATNVYNLISDVITQTAAEWTADTTTVLGVGQIGRESDTDAWKFGNGTALWGGLNYYSTEGTPVTLARTQPTGKTADFTLDSDQTTTALSSQILLIDRKVNVDPSADTDITLNSAFDIGTKWEIHVADEDYVTTLVREHPQITFVGDVENGSAIITNIDDKTGIENGYTIDETYFPSSTTVIDKDHASTSIQVSANATGATTPDADLTLDAGAQGTINGIQGDLVLRKGVSIVELVGNSFGADVVVRGDIAGGGGPFSGETITGTTNTNIAGIYFGKAVDVESASGDPTFTVLSEANYGASIQKNTWVMLTWDGTADSFTLVEGADVTLLYPSTEQTLAVLAGGTVMLRYKGSNVWAVSGALTPA